MSFNSKCGPQSAGIMNDTDPISAFEYHYINGEIPKFSFSPYTTNSTVCLIQSYKIYEREGEWVARHSDFSPTIGALSDDESQVTFYLNEEKLGYFQFKIKVEADGGETLWTESKYFRSRCGNESA